MFSRIGVLDEVEGALDRLNARDRSMLSPAEKEEAALQLERVRAKFSVAETTIARDYQTSMEWKAKGALHPSGVVAATHRVPARACTKPFTLGHRLAELPALRAALAAGQVTVTHRDRLLAVDNPRTHAALVWDHEEMVGWARTLGWNDFCARLQWWLFEQDPDGKDPGVETRGLDLAQTWQDRWVVRGELDAIGGSIFAKVLKAIEQELFEADWKTAEEQLEREPLVHELGRTPRQRRADALVVMAERAALYQGDGKAVILLSVLLGSESLTRACQLANGIRLTPGQIAPYLDDDRTHIETVLLDTKMRTIDASNRRVFEGVLKRIALYLSGGCFHAFCDRPPSECQADHRIPHSKGGPTELWNGQGGCKRHNLQKSNKDPTDEGPAP
jgi:hypothetical protein